MQTAEDQFQFFESVFFEILGKEVSIADYRLLGGGSISVAVQVSTNEGKFFVKYNSANHEGMFESEAKGLEILRETATVRIPNVIGWGRNAGKDYLVLEFIDSVRHKPNYWGKLGQKLADLHKNSAAQFGLSFNNYIGSLSQNNEFRNHWFDFFIEKRLNIQAGLALYNGLITSELYKKFQKFYQILPDLLPAEKPSLLHGDLWSGNIMTDEKGLPVLIDPAVYYGNREAELAFTTLFGGFEEEFYQNYRENFPLLAGFDERVPIYNIYPLMVHVNLFGRSYLPPVERTLNRFL